MEIISVKDVLKKYSKVTVLDNISIDIQKGDIVGLIGPSGAGKTTLIKVIMGMEKADSGVVKVLNSNMPSLKCLKNIGYMAQADALYEELTGRENLNFFGRLFRLKKDELKKRIEYTAGLVNLKEDLDKRVKNYSGGMKRRLSIAITLVQDPDVIILDEPTVGIDPKLRLDIWDELIKLKKRGKTILVTTHVMDEAEKCDKIVLIREGKVISKGTKKELLEEYKVSSIEEVFLA